MLIELIDAGFTYLPGTVFFREALSKVNLAIDEGEFIAIVGSTGSGKTTLVQLLCGLIEPTEGKYLFDSKEIYAGSASKLAGREVGLVFQFPETQLFEETVEKDISFGPRNFGMAGKEAGGLVKEALACVGLDYAEMAHRSPFGLSGGEKRLVAIAGVLAMKSRVLILDEPTSGLDAAGRAHVIDIIAGLNKSGVTIIWVTHDMNDVAEFTDRVIALDNGRVVVDGSADNVFSSELQIETIRNLGLGIPTALQLLLKARERGLAVELGAIRMADVARHIKIAQGVCSKGGGICE
jgi:energy-coupling factor transport system ATP-binding protein